jgi:hypothetical protein
MFTKSVQTSLAIAGLFTDAWYGSVSQAGAATGDARVSGDAQQAKAPVIRVAGCQPRPGREERD